MSYSRQRIIREQLDELKSSELIADWYSYAPGDGKRRWVVMPYGIATRSFATREVEAFIDGLRSAAQRVQELVDVKIEQES